MRSVQSATVLVSEEENLEYLIQSLQAEFELLIVLHLDLFAFHPSANDIQRNVDLLQQAPQVLQDVLLPFVEFFLLRLQEVEGLRVSVYEQNAVHDHL